VQLRGESRSLYEETVSEQDRYAIVFVSDMARSVAFYKDVLGLPLRFESPEWSEFTTEGVTLALHGTEASNPDAPTQGTTPAGHCQVGFSVEDIDAFHEELIAKGVMCIQPPKTEEFGAKLARYTDLDGLQFSVSERPTT
jgi:lactoylglutathione lyase